MSKGNFGNRKAFELDTIMTFVQGIIFVVMVIWLVLFTSQARPDRSEQIGLQVLSEKYPDERNLLYLTDDNGYKLTDLMGRELLMGGTLTLQGDYTAILQDTYPTVFESPFYKSGNSHVACPYPSPIPVEYDSGYNVSYVNISYYLHCYVVPKKLGKLFSYPIDLQKTYELANTGTRIASVWAENNKIYYSVSCNKGYTWGSSFQITGSEDGYFPILANDSTKLYAIWMKVYPTNFIEVAYVETDISTLGCAGIAWSGVSTYTRSLCYPLSPLHGLCSNPKVEEYDKTVWSYVAYCQERVPTYFPAASCTSDKRVLEEGYSYTNLPSIFKEKKDYTYYLSKIEPRYRIDLSYDDGITKADTIYGSESLGGQVRESAPIEFAPPAGFEGAVKMRLTTQ